LKEIFSKFLYIPLLIAFTTRDILFQKNYFAKLDREGIFIVTYGYLMKTYRHNRNFKQITSDSK